MANQDNPAGRLYGLLTAYREIANSNVSVHSTWAAVLGVDEATTPRAIAEAASLITAIDLAIQKSGSQEQRDLYDHFSRAWVTALIPTDFPPRQTPSPGPELIDQSGLLALAGLSAYFSAVQSEGSTPSPDDLKTLRDQIDAVLQEVAASSLPQEVRRILLHRLHDLVWALDHLRVGGPDAVAAVMERLVGQVAMNAEARKQASEPGSIVKKALAAVGAVWVAFKYGPEVKDSLEGWIGVWNMLPPGDEPPAS